MIVMMDAKKAADVDSIAPIIDHDTGGPLTPRQETSTPIHAAARRGAKRATGVD
jgi:hypothetical protein